MDPQAADTGTGLSRKVGPLPLWGWGAAVVVIIGAYYLYTQHSSSSSVDNADGGYSTDDENSGDYSSGYDNGYAAGLNSTGDGTGSSSGGTTTTSQGDAQGPIAHNKFTAKTKDPSGKQHTVTGYGTWIKKSGKWVWQVGIPKQFALPGNGTGTGASAAVPDVSAAMASPTAATDAAPLQAAATTAPASAATIDQATGTSTVGTSGGGATGTTKSGSSGGSAPAQTSNANRIAQIVKDLQNPGPNFTPAQEQQYLASYKTLTGHAYNGKLGQIQVGQAVPYATV